jgi:prepilin-type N-terminal cleavage/methylation domain-containing protein
MIARTFHPRRAFSLIELMVASSIIAVLLIAVQSTIMLAAHSVPAANARSTALVTASAALEQLNADLTYAAAFSARSATSVTFTVPDRTGDGLPDTITWSWDATAKGLLTRQFNGGAAITMAANVRDFSLVYDTRTSQTPGPNVTSAETLFSSFVPTTGQTQKVDSNHFFAEYIRPSLPPNAISWSITRVLLSTQAVGSSTGLTNIQIETADPSNLPTGTVLDTASLDEATLGSSFAWSTFAYANATGLSPTSGACIVAVWVSDTQPVGLQSGSVVLATNLNVYESSGNGGTSWKASSSTSLAHYVYGTYVTPGTPVTQYNLTGVRAALLTSADTSARARATIRVINEPQVPGP